MCSICLKTPCSPRCPNAPEPQPVDHCRKCGKPMCIGNRHFDGICKECLDDMTTAEWLDLFGETLERIEEE